MKDPEYKKLRRLIVVSWALLLLIFVALALWGNNQIKTLKQQLANQSTIVGPVGLQGGRGVTGEVGIPGPRGSSGLQGNTGVQGASGASGASGIQGEAGPKGEPGPAGSPGKVIFVRQNPATGDWECKYSTDTLWSPIEECS